MYSMLHYFLDTLRVLLPLFVVIAGGWIMSAAAPINEETLSRVLVDFFMPLLVFVSLYESTVSREAMGNLLATVLFMMLSTYLIVAIYGRIAGKDIRALALPVIFMNSGFLGFPLMQLWSGSEALNIIIVFDQIYGLFLFTLGFLIIGGGFNLKGLMLSLKSPILIAAAAGFLFHLFEVPVPETILETCRFAGAAAAPLAAFIVGVSLSLRRPKIDAAVIWGILLRIIAGFILGIAAVYIFRLQGLTKTVVLVASALPSAVFSYVLPARYGIDSSDAQSIVVLTTALGIITIPLSFVLASLI
ncbi:AEC family transporter [Marispirochaeta sp.]|jgi:malate permease and related proteins|uniref:AEC family transporter n=1 Tax=Marispirochaeta sp. TaxID=2038653 RepID=UPI0029C97407|nr:AEC family transporter [Marispirochaeta sp.]